MYQIILTDLSFISELSYAHALFRICLIIYGSLTVYYHVIRSSRFRNREIFYFHSLNILWYIFHTIFTRSSFHYHGYQRLASKDDPPRRLHWITRSRIARQYCRSQSSACYGASLHRIHIEHWHEERRERNRGEERSARFVYKPRKRKRESRS